MSQPKTESCTFIRRDGLKNWPLNYPASPVPSPLTRADLVNLKHSEMATGQNFEWLIPESFESFESSPDFNLDLRAWDLASDEALLNFERELT
jgi:hypothetical protein